MDYLCLVRFIRKYKVSRNWSKAGEFRRQLVFTGTEIAKEELSLAIRPRGIS